MPAFESYRAKAFPFRFAGKIKVKTLVGGIPSNPAIIEGWIRTKLGKSPEEMIQEAIAKTMVERGVGAEDAAKIVSETRSVNGFKRSANGLYYEGRCLKAAFKEGASAALAVGALPKTGWGATRKGLLSFIAEHVQVVEDELYLGRDAPDGIRQTPVSTFRGTSIKYEEYVTDVAFDFTIVSDFAFDEDFWPTVWCKSEQLGLGAARSQGFGRYVMETWERCDVTAAAPKVRSAA